MTNFLNERINRATGVLIEGATGVHDNVREVNELVSLYNNDREQFYVRLFDVLVYEKLIMYVIENHSEIVLNYVVESLLTDMIDCAILDALLLAKDIMEVIAFIESIENKIAMIETNVEKVNQALEKLKELKEAVLSRQSTN